MFLEPQKLRTPTVSDTVTDTTSSGAIKDVPRTTEAPDTDSISVVVTDTTSSGSVRKNDRSTEGYSAPRRG
jgi:hypothetical protein